MAHKYGTAKVDIRAGSYLYMDDNGDVFPAPEPVYYGNMAYSSEAQALIAKYPREDIERWLQDAEAKRLAALMNGGGL